MHRLPTDLVGTPSYVPPRIPKLFVHTCMHTIYLNESRGAYACAAQAQREGEYKVVDLGGDTVSAMQGLPTAMVATPSSALSSSQGCMYTFACTPFVQYEEGKHIHAQLMQNKPVYVGEGCG